MRPGRISSLAVKAGATADGSRYGDDKQERKTRTGNKMGIVAFSDSSGQYERCFFSEAWRSYRELWNRASRFVITVICRERGRRASG